MPLFLKERIEQNFLGVGMYTPEESYSKIYYAKDAPVPVGAYPHARKVGDLLFLSGVGPRRFGMDEIPGGAVGTDYDISVQCETCISNIELILASANLGLVNLVDITVFLVDMKRDFANYNRVYERYFGMIKPCRTTLEVRALPTPIAIEFKCTASFII